jgi:AcrR family transcriptional regulator
VTPSGPSSRHQSAEKRTVVATAAPRREGDHQVPQAADVMERRTARIHVVRAETEQARVEQVLGRAVLDRVGRRRVDESLVHTLLVHHLQPEAGSRNAGTRINNITDACGISRAGFYTYFKDKREVFNYLGRETYQDILKTVGHWDTMPRPCTAEDVRAWVIEYFSFMDEHGAFILSSAHSAPDEEDFREDSRRMQMRVAWLLGFSLRSRQTEPTDAPEALGMAIQSMLDRSWYSCKVQQLPISEKDTIRTLTQVTPRRNARTPKGPGIPPPCG